MTFDGLPAGCSQTDVSSAIDNHGVGLYTYALVLMMHLTSGLSAASRGEKLCYRRRTGRRAVSKNLVNCRNKLYIKSATNRSDGVTGVTVRRLVVNITTRRSSYRCRQQARPSTTTTTSVVKNAIDLPWRNFQRPEFGINSPRGKYRNL